MNCPQSSFKINRRAAVWSGVAVAASFASSSAVAENAAVENAAVEDLGAGQWWRWRGPRGDNHAAANAKIPESFSPADVAWSVDLPGRGHSTPIVVDDALYMTTADKASGTQAVLAVGRDGKALWRRVVHRGGVPQENHRKNTEASPTMAFDGQSLFASFYNSDAIQLTKLTTAGEIIWQRRVGRYTPDRYKYGYAASPLLYQDSVIVVGDYDGPAFLTALDRRDGRARWSVKRPGTTSFSSPVVARVAGRDQLLLSGGEMVAAYDPSSGEMLWKVDGATTMATCGTMVWDEERVFASGGYPESETVCVKADGSCEILWSNRTKCYEQSMLAHQGYIYAVADSGVAYCWRATDGETMWQKRLGGKYSSSPLLVGDTVLVFNESGEGFAFAATPESFQSRGEHKLADEVFASPVVVDDTLYLRVANQTDRRQESLLAIR